MNPAICLLTQCIPFRFQYQQRSLILPHIKYFFPNLHFCQSDRIFVSGISTQFLLSLRYSQRLEIEALNFILDLEVSPVDSFCFGIICFDIGFNVVTKMRWLYLTYVYQIPFLVYPTSSFLEPLRVWVSRTSVHWLLCHKKWKWVNSIQLSLKWLYFRKILVSLPSAIFLLKI